LERRISELEGGDGPRRINISTGFTTREAKDELECGE
jgi:hypothetical protein